MLSSSTSTEDTNQSMLLTSHTDSATPTSHTKHSMLAKPPSTTFQLVLNTHLNSAKISLAYAQLLQFTAHQLLKTFQLVHHALSSTTTQAQLLITSTTTHSLPTSHLTMVHHTKETNQSQLSAELLLTPTMLALLKWPKSSVQSSCTFLNKFKTQYTFSNKFKTQYTFLNKLIF